MGSIAYKFLEFEDNKTPSLPPPPLSLIYMSQPLLIC